jgi:hypothetical protein
MIDFDALYRELSGKFGEDAAQHALMRVVEKGWHLDPGTNEVVRFAKVCAYHFKMSEKSYVKKWDELQSELIPQAPEALRLAEAREALKALDPIIVDSAFLGQEDAAKKYRVAKATIGSRVFRAKRRRV